MAQTVTTESGERHADWCERKAYPRRVRVISATWYGVEAVECSTCGRQWCRDAR